MTDTADFFRAHLDKMIDPRHSLLVLESHMLWQQIEPALVHGFERQRHRDKKLQSLALLGPTTTVVGVGASNDGRPRLFLLLMASLLHLTHAFNESTEDVCHRWGETPAWQYFSGENYFYNRPPYDPSSISRFRLLVGEEGVEKLLTRTISMAITMKVIDAQELTTAIVDCIDRPTTVDTNLGYRGVGWKHPDIRLNHRGRFKRLTALERPLFKRRQAIDPVVEHLMRDHRMDRCHLKSQFHDAIHARIGVRLSDCYLPRALSISRQ